jgi:hypothetical protein
MDTTAISVSTSGSTPSANNSSQSPTQKVAASFSDALSSVSGAVSDASTADTTSSVAPSNLLTSDWLSWKSRPSLKEFVDKTGINSYDAVQLVYGVVGSNTDIRDWSAIMSSNDPLTSARQATAQMYGLPNPPVNPSGTYMSSSDTVGKPAGNFAVRLQTDPVTNAVTDSGLKMVDNKGLILRDAGSTSAEIAKNAWLFGFDTSPLTKLSNAAATVSTDLKQAVDNVASVKISDLGDVVAAPVTASQSQTDPSSTLVVSSAAQSAPADVQSTGIVDQSVQNSGSNITPNTTNASVASATSSSTSNVTANNLANLSSSINNPVTSLPTSSSAIQSPATLALSQAQSSATLLNTLLNSSSSPSSSSVPVASTTPSSPNSVSNSDGTAMSDDQIISAANDLVKLVTQAVSTKSMSTLERILSIGGK